jgi:hypothetical protein
MHIIKLSISHDITLEASALNATELAQLMVLVSKCRIYRTTCDKVGDKWIDAPFFKDVELTMSRAEIEHVYNNYEAARAHLKSIADPIDEAAIT